MKALLIIPAFNEAPRLGSLLDGILRLRILSPRDILVVDDGSTDGTHHVAKSKGIRVVRHLENCGKGQALRTGFRIAVEEDYQVVVTMDADLQHSPDEVKDLLDAIRGHLDIVVGSRFGNMEGMPILRYLSNRLTTMILSLAAGKRLEDTQSGFRALKTHVLSRIKLKAGHFALESEILARAARMGFNIGTVPIRTLYFGEKSHVRKLLDTLRFIRLVFQLGWR